MQLSTVAPTATRDPDRATACAATRVAAMRHRERPDVATPSDAPAAQIAPKYTGLTAKPIGRPK